MKLRDHFKQNVSSNIEEGRAAIIAAILADAEALEQLDEEVWLSIEMRLVAGYLSDIHALKHNQAPHLPFHLDQIKRHLADVVYDLWVSEVGKWVDAEYYHTDIRALAEAENYPEPEFDPEAA